MPHSIGYLVALAVPDGLLIAVGIKDVLAVVIGLPQEGAFIVFRLDGGHVGAGKLHGGGGVGVDGRAVDPDEFLGSSYGVQDLLGIPEKAYGIIRDGHTVFLGEGVVGVVTLHLEVGAILVAFLQGLGRGAQVGVAVSPDGRETRLGVNVAAGHELHLDGGRRQGRRGVDVCLGCGGDVVVACGTVVGGLLPVLGNAGKLADICQGGKAHRRLVDTLDGRPGNLGRLLAKGGGVDEHGHVHGDGRALFG